MNVLGDVLSRQDFPVGFHEAIMRVPGAALDQVARIDAIVEHILEDRALDDTVSAPASGVGESFARALEQGWPGFTYAGDVLAGRVLEVVRAGRPSLEGPARSDPPPGLKVQRAAHLVTLLRPRPTGMELEGDGCDRHGRWWPDADPQDETTADVVGAWSQRLNPDQRPLAAQVLDAVLPLLAVIDRASRSTYTLLFPAVPVEESSGTVPEDEARILAARVTVLDPELTARLPRLVLAPWSALLLEGRWLGELRKGLQLLAESAVPEWSELFGPGRFLLELAPSPAPGVSGRRPHLVQPPALAVTGDSLGLAVALAARAAARQRPLRRMIVTGAIASQHVKEVGSVRHKFAAARAYADLDPDRSWLFLVPEEGSPHLDDGGGIEVRRIGTWEDLVRQEYDLLGDGFESYRRAVASTRLPALRVEEEGSGSDAPDSFLQVEVDAFDQTADEVFEALLSAGPRVSPPVVCLPFDNDPAPVARRLVQRLVERINACPGPAPADLAVPLLFPLARLTIRPEAASLVFDQVQNTLHAGLREWGGADGTGSSGGAEGVPAEMLRNAVRGWPAKLLLVVYSPRSTAIALERERPRLEVLAQFQTGAGTVPPRLLWLASDFHHQRWMEDVVLRKSP
jgi:hypothetical protein